MDRRAVSKAQSELLAERLRAAGATAQNAPQKGNTDMTLNRDIGRPDDPSTAVINAFLKRLGG